MKTAMPKNVEGEYCANKLLVAGGVLMSTTWKFEYSVECQVSRDFAWQFWTNVANWAVVDPAVESAKLDGPFVAGAKGVTKPRGSDSVEWRVTEVEDRRRALIEMPAPGAVLRCLLTFEDSLNGGTRITQQMSLDGERAEDYAWIGAQMEKGMPEGMQKLAEAMRRAAGEQA
ncbi:MAG: SRPBCC family protein [Pyrinomonadaceae bacterium]